MLTKTLRVQIVKPYNQNEDKPLTWDELGQVLKDLRYMASKSANYVIQKFYAWEFFRSQVKEETGQYPSTNEHKEKWYWYTDLRRKFPDIAAQAVNQIGRHAEKVWKTRKNEVLSLRQSLPSFKLNFPICVHNESYSIKLVDQSYIIKANLLSEYKERTSFTFIVKAGEKSKRAILNRIISGEYTKGALQIVSDKKNKWYCLIPYKFKPDTDNELDPEKIMGLDLGVANAVYWAFSDSLKRGKLEGKEIEVFRKRVQERRKSIQRQGKCCGQGRIGHGVKRRLEPVEVLQEKESNFRALINHRYAKRIVEIAKQSKCGIIQMEDMTDIRSIGTTFLQTWPYYDLQQKIVEKASIFGIKIVMINPKYTSQRCYRCGYIDRKNRPDQATFECKSCGYGSLYHCFDCDHEQAEAGGCEKCGGTNMKKLSVHADYNAAKNIATPGIEKIISDEIKKQEKEEKLLLKEEQKEVQVRRLGARVRDLPGQRLR